MHCRTRSWPWRNRAWTGPTTTRAECCVPAACSVAPSGRLPSAHRSAPIARVERGIACGAAGQVLGALSVLRAEAHQWRGENADSERWGLQALRELPRGSVAWYTAVRGVGRAFSALGRREQLVGLINELVA